jgi:hypothetical protein
MSELRIMEWEGKFRIESGRQDGDKWWADKIRKKTWDKDAHAWVFEDKDRNLSLPLGNKENAIELLTGLLNSIGTDAPPF